MSQRTMEIFRECAPIFSMLQDENRQKILILLFDNNEMTVTDITEQMELSRPAVSHHLKLLLDADLLSVRKEGKERYYKLMLDSSISLLHELLDAIEKDSLKK